MSTKSGMDDELDDCDYDIDLGNEDEDALLADDFQDDGQYDQTAEDVLDLNPENDLEGELSTTGVSKQYGADVEASFDRTREEEQDARGDDGFETSRVDSSFDHLHDESDEEDKDCSNRDRFKSERSQILPPTNTNAIPDSLESVVSRLPPSETQRDKWQHGRRGKRGISGRPMGQIRPFAPPFSNRGNQNQRGGYRPRFQHRGGNSGGNPVPKKILINPHFQGAVQPQPGSGRLVWDTAIIPEPPVSFYQPPAVDQFQHGRPEEQEPWAFPPSPWIDGFRPGVDSNLQAQQYQQHPQHQQHLQHQQHPQQQHQQQPGLFTAHSFSQPQQFHPQSFRSTGVQQFEQAHLQEQQMIHDQQLRDQQMEEHQREIDYQLKQRVEDRRLEMMRIEEPMAQPVQNFDRRPVFTRHANTFGHLERDMQEGHQRPFATQQHFSSPPPSCSDYYPEHSMNSQGDSINTSPFRNPTRPGPSGQPPLFSHPPPLLPQPEKGMPLHGQQHPFQGQGPPGYNKVQTLHNQGPAIHSNPQSYNPILSNSSSYQNQGQPYQNPGHSMASNGPSFGRRSPPFRSQAPPVRNQKSDFAARQTFIQPIRQESPPQQVSMIPIIPSGRNQEIQQQSTQNRQLTGLNNQRVQQTRQPPGNVQQVESNRRVILPDNQRVRPANQVVRPLLQQLNPAQTTVQKTLPIQSQRPRTMNQQTSQFIRSEQSLRPQASATRFAGPKVRQPGPSNQPGPNVRQQALSQGTNKQNVQQGSAIRQRGPPIRQQVPPIRQQGPPIRQQGPPIRQQGPSIRQQGPSIRQQGPSIRQQGISVRQQGPSVRQQGPSGNQQGLPDRQQGNNAQQGQQASNRRQPSQVQEQALRILATAKRQQPSATDQAKRAKLAAMQPVAEEAANPDMEDVEDEEEDASLREYRKQIAKQKRLREAVLQAKEVRRHQAAMQRLIEQDQKQEEDLNAQGEDQSAFPVGEAIATIVNRNPVEPTFPSNHNRFVKLGNKGPSRR